MGKNGKVWKGRGEGKVRCTMEREEGQGTEEGKVEGREEKVLENENAKMKKKRRA